MRIPTLAAVLLLAGFSGAAPSYGQQFDAAQLAFQERPAAALPRAAVLRDSDGRAVHLGELGGGLPLILVLGYFHCPNLCSVVRASLYRALGASELEPGRDYAVAVISIDPTETVEQAREAKLRDAASFDAPRPASFHYLTTTRAQLQPIADAIGFHERRGPATDQFIHPAGIVFATARGMVSSYLLGVGYKPAEVRSALALARSEGVSATPSPILLICFHFDASTGRYTLDILRVLRLGALLTVILLAVLVLRMVRHERRP